MQRTQDADHTDGLIAHGRALVWAIEALGTVQPSRPFEGELAQLLQAAYRRYLQAIVAEAPSWATEEIMNSSEFVLDERLERWLSQTEKPENPSRTDWAALARSAVNGREWGKVPESPQIQADSSHPRGSPDQQPDTPITKRACKRGTRDLPI